MCHCSASGPLNKATGQGPALGVILCPPHRVLGEAVLPFPLALAEVTLGIGRGRRVILRSYQEEEEGEGARRGLGWGAEQGSEGIGPTAQVPPVPAPSDSTVKAMVTEMSIGEEDFQELQAQEGAAITFCLKEFRVRSLPCPHCPVSPAPPRCHCSASPLLGTPELRRLSKLVSQHSL